VEKRTVPTHSSFFLILRKSKEGKKKKKKKRGKVLLGLLKRGKSGLSESLLFPPEGEKRGKKRRGLTASSPVLK